MSAHGIDGGVNPNNHQHSDQKNTNTIKRVQRSFANFWAVLIGEGRGHHHAQRVTQDCDGKHEQGQQETYPSAALCQASIGQH